MSKNWYPMINYEDCIECGACIEKCSHGVYDESKAPVPHVINQDNCVEGCTGCGSLCPVEAITYFGDNGDIQRSGCCSGDECGCSGGCDCDGGSDCC